MRGLVTVRRYVRAIRLARSGRIFMGDVVKPLFFVLAEIEDDSAVDRDRPCKGKRWPVRSNSEIRTIRSNRFRLKPHRSLPARNFVSPGTTTMNPGASLTSASAIP
jgi:hypothetical protein